MKKNRNLYIFYIGVIAIFFSIIFYYIFSNYQILESPLETIRLEMNEQTLNKGLPILYVNKNDDPNIDFEKVFRFQKLNDSVIEINNLEKIHISGFRVYFEYPGEDFFLKKITLLNNSKILSSLTLNPISDDGTGIEIVNSNTFNVNKVNAFIEYPFHLIYKFPKIVFILLLLCLTLVLLFLFRNFNFFNLILGITKKEIVVILFLFSLFAVEPIYNITLIFGVIFYLKDFKLTNFLKNKMNVLFILFFLVYLVNTIFIKVNEIRDFTAVEKYLPFLFIPILLFSAKPKMPIYFITFSAFIITFGLVSFSLIDLIITHKTIYFSFDNFSKYYHPVYLSYLIFLSFFYIQIAFKKSNKYYFQSILLILLIFLGSKLVLVCTILVFLVFFMEYSKKEIKPILLLFIIVIPVIFIFKPIQKRFLDIVNFNDLSILKEVEISNPNDSRLNGLSIRLILWRETLSTLENSKEIIFGNGVSKSKTDDLKEEMINLGLPNHSGYNPHNQYIDTVWKTGVIGLIILILIPFYGFFRGIKTKNKLLISFSILMIVCMFTESIFGRVRGVYFFTTILVLLTNKNNEIHEDNNLRY